MHLDPNDPKSIEFETLRHKLFPALDRQVRDALWMIWCALPPERQNADEVEREFRRLADRALANLRDDAAAFGLPNS